MLVVKSEVHGDITKITMRGVFDEMSDLTAIQNISSPRIDIDCGDVSRINSFGVKLWQDHFGRLRAEGRKLRFIRMAPQVIYSANCIFGFVADGEVHSVMVPFQCRGCSKSFTLEMPKSEVVEFAAKPASRPCPECGALSELDEDPADYFSFLKK